MSDFNNYLDQYRAKNNLKSDTAMAERLGISRQYICGARKKGFLSDELCEKLARSIGVEPILVMAARESYKEELEGRTGPWTEGLHILKNTAAGFIIIFITGLHSIPQGDSNTLETAPGVYYRKLAKYFRNWLSCRYRTKQGWQAA